MSIPEQTAFKIRFGEFELDRETAEIRRKGSKTIIPGQPFQILTTLLDRPGQLVTRDELKKLLWPSDTFVDFDQSLNKAVNRLREVLEDSADHPRFIETLPRKGYRFIGVVETSRRTTVAADGPEPAVLTSPNLPESEVGSIAQIQAIRSDLPESIAPRAEQTISTPHAAPIDSVSRSASDPEISSDRGHRRVTPPGRRRFLLASLVSLIFIAAAFAMFRWFAGPGTLDLASVHFIKLTDSGRVQEVAISPDGRYVVFSLSDGDQESLHLSQVAARSEVQILTSGPGFHGLTFSPDGDYLYFVRSDPNDPFFKYLYSMPVLGGPARRMIADVDSPVGFSPDGSRFVFERAIAVRSLIELRVANADGSGEYVLAQIQNGDAGLFQPGPSWSRDGRTIVVPVRFGDFIPQRKWVLESVSLSDGKLREIYSSPFPLGRPVWLPSGDSLVVPHWDPEYERAQLWTISYPGGEAKRFTNDLTDYDSSLDITRDGKTIASTASSVVSNVFVASLDDSLSTRQITSGVLPFIAIAEASDGKLLSVGGDGRIWRMNSDGSQRAPFTDEHSVGWVRRCGSFVLFTSNEANTTTLTRVNEDGSRPLKLMSGDLHFPGCSADGKSIYFVNKHRPQKIWRLSTEGGSPVEIAPALGEGVTGQLDVSPDGKLLSYAYDEYGPPRWKLAVIPAAGGVAVKTFKVQGGIILPRWSPDGSGLQYLLTQNGAANIWEQSLSGRDARQLTHFNSGVIFDYTWSSDRQRLLMTRGEITSDVVLLSNLH